MSEFDISNLTYYLNNFDYLSSFEFEDMVAQLLRCKGWTNVELTGRTADMGRDIIGYDKKGRKTYVEVKRHKNKIGRPVIQKLHSIMITENVEKGLVVTTSNFTPEAIEYARTTNIKLMGGKKFIETCNFLIKNAPRSNSLCTPINIEKMLTTAHDLLDMNVFSYPKSPSKFLVKSTYMPFKYKPYTIAIATIDQDFQNKSGSFYYHMHIPNGPFILSEYGELLNEKLSDVKFEYTVDLKNIERQLNQMNIAIQKEIEPPIDRDKLRKFIQRICTVKRKYRGQNNQVYTRTCKPSLANIDINAIYKYWQLYNSVELKIDQAIKFKAFFKDGKSTGFIIENFPTEKKNPKIIKMCQSCLALLFKGAPKKKDHACQECGAIICEDCAYSERSAFWCINCAKKLKYGTITHNKNKEALKSMKKEFQNWKRIKKPISIKFISNQTK